MLALSASRKQASAARLKQSLQQHALMSCTGTATTAEAETAPKDEQAAVTSLALTSSLQSAFSPQFAPAGVERKGGGRLLFLSQDAACESGTHDGTVALHSLPWPAEVMAKAAGPEHVRVHIKFAPSAVF